MALPLPKAPGYMQMMKEGSSYYAGIEEAVLRSIEACSEFSKSLQTSYGPKGLNKMVINHLDKLFVTNDAATIIKQLDVQHPAAKLMVMASEMQEKEIGDATNFVIILAGALLEKAEDLIRMGLKPVEIVEGYQMALQQILDKYLVELVCDKVENFRDREQVIKGIRTSIMSKQYGNEDFLTKLVAEACLSVHKEGTTFNVDNVRVCKILGSGITKSQVVQGMVFKRNAEGTVTKAKNAKVAVFTCPVDVATTETKGTVLIKTAEELMNFNKDEENMFEAQIKAISDSGVNVIVSGGKFGDIALHYCNKYGIMAVRVMSKFDVRRIAKTVNATALPKLIVPKTSEMGQCDNVYIDEIGGTSVVMFQQDMGESNISTIIIRGSTDNIMDDIERAVDDGINTYKALTKDERLLPGAGATEIELSRRVGSYGEALPGMEQYAIQKYAEALQSVIGNIASNAGIKSSDMIILLLAAHQEGKLNAGMDIEAEVPTMLDAKESKIYDLFLSKYWAIKYATNAAITVLTVDQIIMSKPAGGPKPRQPGGDWDAD